MFVVNVAFVVSSSSCTYRLIRKREVSKLAWGTNVGKVLI